MYQTVDVTYIFHILKKYVIQLWNIYKAYNVDIVNPLKNIVTNNFPSNTFEQL